MEKNLTNMDQLLLHLVVMELTLLMIPSLKNIDQTLCTTLLLMELIVMDLEPEWL